MFHHFLELLYTKTDRDGHDFVRMGLYELYAAGTSQLITLDSWLAFVQPGSCVEMGIMLVQCDLEVTEIALVSTCPYCAEENHCDAGHNEVVW